MRGKIDFLSQKRENKSFLKALNFIHFFILKVINYHYIKNCQENKKEKNAITTTYQHLCHHFKIKNTNAKCLIKLSR